MKGHYIALLLISLQSIFGFTTLTDGHKTIKTLALQMGLADTFKSILGLAEKRFPEPCVMGDESIMAPKEHGTSKTPVQENLRWGCDRKTADRICNFNRHYAEYRGYWTSTNFLKEENGASGPIKFYDSNTGKLLFEAPKGRTYEEFVAESRSHGWPSFRDEEVNWEYVRCLPDGETVSIDGTHLGHNLPDSSGSRYCINLVSVCGRPDDEKDEL